MSEPQFAELINTLKAIGENLATTPHYTLNGAEDWDTVVTLISCFGGLILVLMTFNFTLVKMLWTGVEKKMDELTCTISKGLGELKKDHMNGLKELKQDNLNDHGCLWGELHKIETKFDTEMERCKRRCCEGE